MSEAIPPSHIKTNREGSLSNEPVKKQDAILHAEHIESATSVEHVDDLVKTRTFDNSIDDTKPSRKVWTIIFTVAMGGFLFGYDTGYISAVLVSIGDDLGHTLSSKEQELITSITSGGALIGALIAGLPADKFGRKFGIYVGCALFIIGSIIQAAAFSVPQMTVGRFVVGLGVGSASMIVPLYIGEISVAKYRGRMVALNNVSVTFGQLISYVLGAGFVHVSHGWRYMVAIGGVPPMLLAVLLIGCPESPRLLVMHQKIEQAKKALTSLYPYASEAQVRSKIDLLIYAIEEEAQIVGSRSLWTQFKELHCIPANLRALTSACGVMAISQLSGFNTILYYGATLFGLVGFKNPTAVSITIGATNFIFNIVNFFVIDRAGRRIVLSVTLSIMFVSMTVTAIAFHWIPVSKDLVLLSTSTNWASIVVLITIIVYVASFSSGVATIAWVGTELLPIEVRAVGTVMNNVTCWGANIIVSSTFLSLLKSLTPSGTFGLYAGICFFGWIFVKLCFPEVNGMPLEDIRQIFEHGFGVKTAKNLQKVAAAGNKDKDEIV
ncbi:myo-inositol transporter [Xylaria flabelliformis]|nr:myo-inositol transporter [Xylaria flabelliformis]